MSSPSLLIKYRSTLKSMSGAVILLIFFLPTLVSSAQVPRGTLGQLLRRTSAAVSSSQSGRWDTGFGSPGMNDVVREILVDRSGNFIAGGGFTSAGGTTANRIASFDGTSWQAMGAGFNNTVFAMAEDWNGNIFAAGNFTQAEGASAARVAMWDGASWSPLGAGIAGDAVRDLAFDNNGNLYAAGKFSTTGGYPAAAIARWNGGVWSNVGSGISGYLDTIYALAVDGADLYAAGSFNQAGSGPASNVAKWNGSSWNPLGDGLNSGAYALQVINGELYVGGTFTQDWRPSCSLHRQVGWQQLVGCRWRDEQPCHFPRLRW